jgi:hypothetical protein
MRAGVKRPSLAMMMTKRFYTVDDRGSEKIEETPRKNGRHSHLGVDDIKLFTAVIYEFS